MREEEEEKETRTGEGREVVTIESEVRNCQIHQFSSFQQNISPPKESGRRAIGVLAAKKEAGDRRWRRTAKHGDQEKEKKEKEEQTEE